MEQNISKPLKNKMQPTNPNAHTYDNKPLRSELCKNGTQSISSKRSCAEQAAWSVKHKDRCNAWSVKSKVWTAHTFFPVSTMFGGARPPSCRFLTDKTCCLKGAKFRCGDIAANWKKTRDSRRDMLEHHNEHFVRDFLQFSHLVASKLMFSDKFF